jgi:glycosyltransferase involved in cell wall biosynthesis
MTRWHLDGLFMISVIVPVFNTARYLDRVIEALENQDYPRSEFELIFVDNGSVDQSREILERHSGLRVLSETERGSYAARNRAIHAARGEILAFTDSDCLPCRDWLRAIDLAFTQPGAQVVLGPRNAAPGGRGLRLVSAYENHKMEMVCSWSDPLVYYGYTNNMAMRARTMERFGPFEHRDRGADTIFVRRVVDGLSCDAVRYCPDMIVQHAELDSIGVYYRKISTYARSPGSYRHIIATRPLSFAERLRVYRRTSRQLGVAESVQLFILLAGGALAWWRGRLGVKESDW